MKQGKEEYGRRRETAGSDASGQVFFCMRVTGTGEDGSGRRTMKRLNWKRWLCAGLAAGMALLSPLTAAAQEKTAEDFLRWEGMPEVSVSQEEVEAAEQKYEREQMKGLSQGEKESAEALAAKRAYVLTSLYGLTSVQYALIQDGEIVIEGSAGLGKLSTKKAPDQDSMYGIASISKIFVTAAVMQLAEQGKVSLDTPVVKYIPEFKMKDSRYKDITVRMLLNHSSGLMGSSLKNAILLGDNTTYNHDNFLKMLQKQTLKADPGAYSVYCNDGFTLAEILVEKVTGQDYAAYVAQYITGPLGLKNTKAPSDSFSRKQLADIHTAASRTALPYEAFNALGAGGLYSTARDLCVFADALMRPDGSFLSAQSVSQMGAPEYARGLWPEEDAGILAYGLGWDSVSVYPFSQYGITGWSKGGDSLYYHSELIALPDLDMAVAVASSGGSSSINQIFGQSILLDLLQEQGVISSVSEEPHTLTPGTGQVPADYKENFAGTYVTAGGSLSVEFTDHSMVLASVEAPASKQELTYNGNGEFLEATGTNGVFFVKESNGETYMGQRGYAYLPGIGETYSSVYMAQKTEPKPLSSSVAKAWRKRDGKKYFMVSEKYTSAMYLSNCISRLTYKDSFGNYLYGMEILDENTMAGTYQIPMTAGRDLDTNRFTVSENNGYHYITTGSYSLVEEKAVKNLSSKSRFTVTIGSLKGYAKWYEIGSKAAGRTIKLTMPKQGGYFIYDKDGNYITSYLETGKKTVKLPKSGYIMFAGAKKAKFTVQYVK